MMIWGEFHVNDLSIACMFVCNDLVDTSRTRTLYTPQVKRTPRVSELLTVHVVCTVPSIRHCPLMDTSPTARST